MPSPYFVDNSSNFSAYYNFRNIDVIANKDKTEKSRMRRAFNGDI